MGAGLCIDRSGRRAGGGLGTNLRQVARPAWLLAVALALAACSGGDEVGEAPSVTESASASTLPATTEGATAADPEVPATISVSDSGSDSEVSFYVETPTGLAPVPFGAGIPVQTEAVSGTGTYTCEGDLLTITADSEAGSFTTYWDRIG